MPRFLGLLLLLLTAVPAAAQVPLPKPLVSNLPNARFAAVAANGSLYVATNEGKPPGEKNPGSLMVVSGDKATTFATGLDDPRGVAAWQQWVFVADKTGVVRVNFKGKLEPHAPNERFPTPPKFLTALTADEQGNLYVADAGEKGEGVAIYKIQPIFKPKAPPEAKVTKVTDAQRFPGLKRPWGLVMDGLGHLLVTDAETGDLHRVRIADGSATKVAGGFTNAGGLAWDRHGRLYVAWGGADKPGVRSGRVSVIGRPGQKPVLLTEGFGDPVGLCLDSKGKQILVADPQAGTLTALPATVPGAEVDETPLPLATEVAFPKLKWTGWQGTTDAGKINPLRPIVLTHANDASNRVFVATQQGVIHVFPNDQKADKTTVFLDIQERVIYQDKQNEEGFLGMAFHPDYKRNGEFYVFYTLRKEKMTNVLSRFRVSKNDPNKADPDSEEILLRVKRPFWNHDGGTVCFGPDGYLYLALGDGGSANDPFNNAQNLKSLLGKVLRIDVNKKDGDKPYAIPRDNPFVDKKDALPETWCYGLRNVWRMAFDRKTGKLWAGEVGQNLYEEINILKAGGNYGWKLRESLHPFMNGVDVRDDLIEPIWEYHHDTGKSITGGAVYRGKALPEIDGAYIYADYVSGKIWALWYDEAKGRVTANRPIPDRNQPILSFGEDEAGEIYYLTYTPSGQGIYRFVRAKQENEK